jgi:hypothetical protein
MTSVATLGPSTAERVRSACLRAEHAVLAAEGSAPVVTSVHHLRAPGEMVLVVPSGSTPDGPAVLELTDHAPVELRERVRSLVWISGDLCQVPDSVARSVASAVAADYPHPGLLDVGHGSALLRLMINSVVVADGSGAEAVAVEDLLRAEPDPFWEVETGWLQHLDSDHSELVAKIARRLPPSMRQGVARPLGIDRYGVRLRIEGPHGDNDVRIPFAAPVDDVAGLSQAIRVLMGCPFLNGLRARD